MPYLFDHFDEVKRLMAVSPFGLFTDVDGTISEIAPTPGEARVSPGCRESLAVLAQHLAVVAAVSGRPAAEARTMVGVDDMVYIGNHGYETWAGGEVRLAPGVGGYPARIGAVMEALQGVLRVEGLVFENKGPTASIHYRRCRDREAARAAIMSALGELPEARDLKVSPGRMVVEIRPPLEVTKGTSVLSLIEEHRLCGAVYLGDDQTDVDVFRAFHERGLPFRGLAVAVVGEETAPGVEREADFTLNGVGDVERFLRRAAAEAAGRRGSSYPGTGGRATS